MFFRKWKKDYIYQSKGFYKLELNKKVIKVLLNNVSSSNMERIYFFHLLTRMPTKYSISFIRKFCVLSGYPKSVFRKFKLSRHQAKRMASYGYLVGLRKSSF